MKRTILFKKFLNSLGFAFVAVLGITTTVTAQSTINTTVGSTGYTGTNSAGNGYGITFVVNNTTNDPIILTDVGDWTQSTDNGTNFTLYYSSTLLGGVPTTTFPSAGWTQIATAAASGITNASLSVNNVLSNMTFQIPANTMYRFSLVTSGLRRYSGTGVGTCTPDSFLNNGIYLYVGDYQIGGGYVGYGATNGPRFFTGSITFVPALPCTAPPVAGAASASNHTPCIGQNVDISTVGANFGLGLTYQWQSGSSAAGPFANVTGATNPTYSFSTSASGTTYYRLGLTCSGQTAYSTPDSVVVPVAFPGGTYTVNPALAPSASNFTSVAAALNAMNCGISGSIILNLAPGNTFNEQATIASTMGTSATKTLTINGNADTLTFNGSSTLPWTLGLNGADYVTVNNLVVVGTNTTSALVTHLWNDADNNAFNNCKFFTMPNTTSTTVIPFSVSGSPISGTTAGASGSGNVLDSCTMFGGYYNTVFYGPSATTQSTGNKVLNCTLLDYYFYGSYNLYQANLEIKKNHISRPTRTTLSTFYGIYLSTGVSNALVEKNWIGNQFGANPTYSGTSYNIYVTSTSATVGNENKIFNNVLGNMNGNGSVYGLYLPSATNVQVYNNTVSIDNTLATTGTIYGIYSTGTTNVDIQNNNISVTQGGTGTKYCIYFSGVGKTSNYNNLYMGSTGGTANNVGYYVTAFANLAAWQGANTNAWDQASVSVDPIFLSPLTGNFTPTNAALDNLGTPIAAITTDILGATRSLTTPDIGAFEFSVSNCTGTVVAGTIDNAPTMNVCAGYPVTLHVTGATLPAGGINYQWQQRVPAGTGTWQNIAGANSTTLNLPLAVSVPTDFRFFLACTLGTSSDTTAPIALNLNPANQCYCAPSGNSVTYYIDTFVTTGGLTNITNNASGYSTNGYGIFTAQSASQAIGGTINFSGSYGSGTNTFGTKIWVDWNQDGNFDNTTEVVFATSTYANIQTGSFVVPATATLGTTRMRIGISYTPSTGPATPCVTAISGEFEDYSFVVTSGTTCTPPVVNLGPDTTICAGQTLTLNAGAANATFTKLWSNAATTQTIAVTTAGTYSVMVTDGACVGKDTIVVGVTALPVVNLGADTAICAGSTLTLSAGAANSTYTKLWSNLATTQTIPVTTAGTYSVKVTNGACSKSDTIIVSINALPVVNLGNDTAICSGSTLTLSAGAANSTYTKLWSNLATTQTIAVTTAGTYSVKVTNGACFKSDTVVVTVNPTPVVNLGADTSICAGTSLTLNAGNAGATYLWTGGTTAQTLAVTTAGTYGVTVTKTGCMATDSIVVGVTALPSITGITATGAAPTFAFTANGATNVTTYAWTFGDGGTSAIAAPTHTYVQTEVDQTFTVTLIVSNECGSDTVTTTVNVPKLTGINTLQLDAKQLKLYPNPAQQLVTVENDSKLTMKQIRITNILGQEVARIAVSNQAKQTINVANLAAGLYNVTIEFEEGSVNRKLEILK